MEGKEVRQNSTPETPALFEGRGFNHNQVSFLNAYSCWPHNKKACEKAGIHRTNPWKWRKEDEAFDAAFEEAEMIGIQAVRDIGVDMAEEQNVTSVYRLLEAHDRRFRQKHDVEVTGRVEHVVKRIQWEEK